jgi:NitT/TauT family transport system substrate-binding protein
MAHGIRAWAVGMAAALVVTGAAAADALEKVKAASGGRGSWDAMVTSFALDQGFFKDEGLDVDLVWTRGGAETLQAVITGSVDLGLSNGLLGVLGAFEKKAPLRVVSAQMTGAGDLFWYVRADSPIKSLKDANGKTMAYSRPGSSSHLIAQALARHAGVTPKFVSAGLPPDTRTLVMSGQIDIGWSFPPLILDLEQEGKVRIVANGNDVPALREQTVRVNVANASFLKSRRDVARAFFKVHARTIKWMFETPEATLRIYAEENKLSIPIARRAVSFYQPRALGLAPVSGLEASMAEAVEFKSISRPLTPEELGQLIDLVHDPAKP